jgi:shikimate dehydrogenase
MPLRDQQPDAPLLAGVIGDPVEHSRSPGMHNAAFARLGIAARYERWHTSAAQLPARVESLRRPGVLGANVTLPHKIAVLAHVDRRDPAVDLIGAANTIVREPDGTLTATNTDAPAVLATLREDAGFEPAGCAAVILGASGAARAAAYVLAEAGASQIHIVNRTLERAEELLADLIESTGTETPLIALAPDDPDLGAALAGASLIVNATSLGWRRGETPLAAAQIPAGALVFDMVYRPTQLLADARARGARALDGRGMLVRQAGLAFERWTGLAPPLDVMFEAFDAQG